MAAKNVKSGLFKEVKFCLMEDGDDMSKVQSLLLEGGGHHQSYLSDMVTHVISDNPDSSGVSEAQELFEKPVVTSHWVILSARCSHLLPLNGFSPLKNQLFSGTLVCHSKITKTDKKNVWAMVSFYGGVFQWNLTKSCTHLIIGKPEGTKYQKALQHPEMKIVTPDWIVDSVKCGKLCDENMYHPKLLILPQPEIPVVSVIKTEASMPITSAVISIGNMNITERSGYVSAQVHAINLNAQKTSCSITQSVVGFSDVAIKAEPISAPQGNSEHPTVVSKMQSFPLTAQQLQLIARRLPAQSSDQRFPQNQHQQMLQLGDQRLTQALQQLQAQQQQQQQSQTQPKVQWQQQRLTLAQQQHLQQQVLQMQRLRLLQQQQLRNRQPITPAQLAQLQQQQISLQQLQSPQQKQILIQQISQQQLQSQTNQTEATPQQTISLQQQQALQKHQQIQQLQLLKQKRLQQLQQLQQQQQQALGHSQPSTTQLQLQQTILQHQGRPAPNTRIPQTHLLQAHMIQSGLQHALPEQTSQGDQIQQSSQQLGQSSPQQIVRPASHLALLQQSSAQQARLQMHLQQVRLQAARQVRLQQSLEQIVLRQPAESSKSTRHLPPETLQSQLQLNIGPPIQMSQTLLQKSQPHSSFSQHSSLSESNTQQAPLHQTQIQQPFTRQIRVQQLTLEQRMPHNAVEHASVLQLPADSLSIKQHQMVQSTSDPIKLQQININQGRLHSVHSGQCSLLDVLKDNEQESASLEQTQRGDVSTEQLQQSSADHIMQEHQPSNQSQSQPIASDQSHTHLQQQLPLDQSQVQQQSINQMQLPQPLPDNIPLQLSSAEQKVQLSDQIRHISSQLDQVCQQPSILNQANQQQAPLNHSCLQQVSLDQVKPQSAIDHMCQQQQSGDQVEQQPSSLDHHIRQQQSPLDQVSQKQPSPLSQIRQPSPMDQIRQHQSSVDQMKQQPSPLSQIRQLSPLDQTCQQRSPLDQIRQQQSPLDQIRQQQSPLDQIRQQQSPLDQIRQQQSPLDQIRQQQSPLDQIRQQQSPLDQIRQQQSPLDQIRQQQSPLDQIRQQQSPLDQIRQQQSPLDQIRQQQSPLDQIRQQQSPLDQIRQQQSPLNQIRQQSPLEQIRQQQSPSSQNRQQQSPLDQIRQQQSPLDQILPQQSPLDQVFQQSPLDPVQQSLSLEQHKQQKSPLDQVCQHSPLNQLRQQQSPINHRQQQSPLNQMLRQTSPSNAIKQQQSPLDQVRQQSSPLDPVRIPHSPLEPVRIQAQPIDQVRIQRLASNNSHQQSLDHTLSQKSILDQVQQSLPLDQVRQPQQSPLDHVSQQSSPLDVHLEKPPLDQLHLQQSPLNQVRFQQSSLDQNRLLHSSLDQVRVQQSPIDQVRIHSPSEQVNAQQSPVGQPRTPTMQQTSARVFHSPSDKHLLTSEQSVVHSFHVQAANKQNIIQQSHIQPSLQQVQLHEATLRQMQVQKAQQALLRTESLQQTPLQHVQLQQAVIQAQLQQSGALKPAQRKTPPQQVPSQQISFQQPQLQQIPIGQIQIQPSSTQAGGQSVMQTQLPQISTQSSIQIPSQAQLQSAQQQQLQPSRQQTQTTQKNQLQQQMTSHILTQQQVSTQQSQLQLQRIPHQLQQTLRHLQKPFQNVAFSTAQQPMHGQPAVQGLQQQLLHHRQHQLVLQQVRQRQLQQQQNIQQSQSKPQTEQTLTTSHSVMIKPPPQYPYDRQLTGQPRLQYPVQSRPLVSQQQSQTRLSWQQIPVQHSPTVKSSPAQSRNWHQTTKEEMPSQSPNWQQGAIQEQPQDIPTPALQTAQDVGWQQQGSQRETPQTLQPSQLLQWQQLKQLELRRQQLVQQQQQNSIQQQHSTNKLAQQPDVLPSNPVTRPVASGQQQHTLAVPAQYQPHSSSATLPYSNQAASLVIQTAAQVTPKTKTALANLLNTRLQGTGRSAEDGSQVIVRAAQIITQPPTITQRATVEATSISPSVAVPNPVLSERNSVTQTSHVNFYGHDPRIQVPPDLSLLGCTFVIQDYDQVLEGTKLEVWKKVITQNGGEVEPSYSSKCTHVLCDSQRNSVVQLALREGKRCVTAHWLNDILQQKKMKPPWRALHLPLPFSEDKPCKNQIITITNFDGEERKLLKHMIQALGAKFTGYMSMHNTLIICKRKNSLKSARAKDWKIPIVNVQWLHDVMFGHYDALRLPMAHKYQQFDVENHFKIDYALVPHLMTAWKVAIKISEEMWKKFHPLSAVNGNKGTEKKRKSDCENDDAHKRLRVDSLPFEENIPLTTQNPPDNESKPHVMFTGFENTSSYKRIVCQLGGCLAVSPMESTHLVAKRLARTVKFLCAIHVVRYIVTPEWLVQCEKENCFVDEHSYILRDTEAEKTFGFNLKMLLNRINRSPVFQGIVFFLTPGLSIKPELLKGIIECGGGTAVLKRKPTMRQVALLEQSGAKFIIITCENDLHLCKDFLQKGLCVQNAEFVLTGSIRQELDYESFSFAV